MQQSRGLRRVAAAIAIVVVLLSSACGRDDPERRVRAQVQALQEAIDARDAGAMEGLLAEDFVGNDGLDRHGARRLAAAVFLRHREGAARLGPVEVELRGASEAIARFSVVATAGAGGLLPERGQVYRVETGWRLVGGEWRLLSASWTPGLADGRRPEAAPPRF